MQPSYLQELTIRLATGAGKLPESYRALQSQYLIRQMRPDGGFAGREGESDLYYTGFGLRSLAVLGQLYGGTAERAAEFLASRMQARTSVIDLLSLIYGAALVDAAAGIDVFANADSQWKDRLAEFLNSLRREDGGFAKTPEGHASSTYNTFLVILCLQLLEKPIHEPEQIIHFLHSRRNDEMGGFCEIRASKRPGTNPTAAAIATLKILDALDEESAEGAIDLIADMQSDDGGLRANNRIPLADLLSTFTGLMTLCDLRATHEIELDRVQKFVESLELKSGGYQAVTLDPAHDVEYTFYGIGARALLADLLET